MKAHKITYYLEKGRYYIRLYVDLDGEEKRCIAFEREEPWIESKVINAYDEAYDSICEELYNAGEADDTSSNVEIQEFCWTW